ncbi:MAG: hypothetical protein Q9M31_07255 [Mariprofundus sp.]|nr:hypothetical protein [Mariprofundus sp.]
MIEKPISELNLYRSKEPMPTVEVDLGSIKGKERHDYTATVAQALLKFVELNPESRATIYVYQGGSVNFQDRTFSTFFGVDGQDKEKLLRLVLRTYRKFTDRAKLSDYIEASSALCELHIEDGRVWLPLDELNWYAETGN